MLAEEYHSDVVPVLELLLAFEAAKNALVHAKERAQQAVAAKLSAARPAQDEMLRLEALLRRDPAIRDRAPPGIELRRLLCAHWRRFVEYNAKPM